MGSRLIEVIDHPSKRIGARSRFRAIVRWMARLVLVAIAVSWLYLYLDSVYQRRRAEALFADLKSLDFATAGFPEVRDIMSRFGARPGSTCGPQNCTFRLSIMTRLPRTPLLGRKAQFLYTTLPYIGIRSWVAYATFEVRNGKLDSSETWFWEYRTEEFSSGYRVVVPFGYGVKTWGRGTERSSECMNQDYRVFIYHGVFKLRQNALHTCVAQSAGTSVKRAFDVHLRCLNNPFRGCRFDEIAPSAWADYSAKNGAAGTGDPNK